MKIHKFGKEIERMGGGELFKFWLEQKGTCWAGCVFKSGRLLIWVF